MSEKEFKVIGSFMQRDTGALKWKCQSFVCDWEDFVHWESISWGVQRGCWETGEDNEVLKRTGNGFLQNEAPATLSLCFHSLMSPGHNSVGQRFIAYRVYDSRGWCECSSGTQIGRGQPRTPKELKFWLKDKRRAEIEWHKMRNFSRIINMVLHRVRGGGHILVNPESQWGSQRGHSWDWA